MGIPLEVPFASADWFNLAVELANRVHAGVDSSGVPKIMHPIRVMLKTDDGEGRIVRILHDVIEDSKGSVTAKTLQLMGFSDRIVRAVDVLSRRKEDTYVVFIEKIATCDKDIRKLAISAKLDDLDDNIERSRKQPGRAALLKRYLKARTRLIEAYS